MKKQLLFAILFTSCFVSQAQVVMENKLPPIGSKYSLYSVSGLTDAASGANQAWNYGSVTTTILTAFTIVDPATLPKNIKDSVPTATYAAKAEIGAPVSESPYDFIENKSTHYVKVGVKSSGSSPVEKKFDTIMVFSQQFGSTLKYWGMTRKYDAYGTLTVKSKTYQNVVRLKMYSSGNADTLNQFFQFNPHFHLLLSYVKSGSTIKNGLYWEPTSTPGGLRIIEKGYLKIFPNPAEDFFYLEMPQNLKHEQQISILSATGNLVKNLDLSKAQNSLLVSTADLVPGVYFINSGGTYHKLIVR